MDLVDRYILCGYRVVKTSFTYLIYLSCKIIIIIVCSLASCLQIAPVQRHGDDVLVERDHYPSRFAIDGLDDV